MPNRIIKVIKESKSFVIVSHYHPDGDAIGSTLALGLALKKMKKKVVAYNRDGVPLNLKYLPTSDQITDIFPAGNFDCAVMVDCAQPKRISDDFAKAVERKKFKQLVCIDHHLLEQKVGDTLASEGRERGRLHPREAGWRGRREPLKIDWIEPTAASTGEVVWRLLKKLKLHASKEVANLVYCTLVVDTGFFKYSNTTAEVLALASELVGLGADPWLAAKNLEESNPVERFYLLQRALASLKISPNGLYASMDVTQGMLKESGAHDGLSDEFANIPRSILGVEVSVLFREMEDGKIKISLRSKDKVDVARVANQFGGGGHEHAAGCVLNMGLEAAKKQIEGEVRKCLGA